MKFNKLYLAFILLGVIAALGLSYQRAEVENAYKNYEMTMSFEDVKKQAAISGRSIEEELEGWKEAGLNTITLNEETLGTLKMNRDFQISARNRGLDNYIEGTKEGIDFIEKGIKETYIGNRKVERISDTELVIEGKESDIVITKKEGLKNKVDKIGLGYIQKDIDRILEAGFEIRFRPVYIYGEQDPEKAIERLLKYIDTYSNQSYVVFQGNETFAIDADMEELVKAFKERGISVGMIESVEQRKHFEQIGLDDLVKAMDYHAIRVFSTWEFIQKRYDYGIRGHHHGEEIVNAYFRAITERNIRVVFFKPFLEKNQSPVTDMEIYKARLAELKERLEEAPHRIMNVKDGDSEMQVMPAMHNRPLWQIFVGFALVAVFMMILENITEVRRKYRYLLFGMGLFVTALIYLLKIKLGVFNSLYGLASIVLYVILASQFMIMESKKSFETGSSLNKLALFAKSLGLLLITILISLAGAVSEVAFYAESKYLLELGIFRGVKLSQLIPIMLVFFLGLFYFAKIILKKEDMSNIEITKGILNLNVKVWHALIAGIVFMGLGVLLLRSGNSNIEPSELELLMRNILENTLPARPRTKAFIVGYPSAIALYYFASQKRYRIMYPVLVIFIAIGQANILNTFSHFRTPLYLSFMRVFFEFVVAAVLAIVYIVLIELIRKLIKRLYPRELVLK
ncbi:MAG: DUF5693 family protein [Bacillota bacterium]|nr:DUF5693 family protein [Bacillota bacterium]